MKPLHANRTLAGLGIVLSIASFLVVIQGATDEPYLVFRKADAVVQVGVAMMLMLLWVQLAVWVVAGVVRCRVSAWWLALVLWALICEAYLLESPRGYMLDITRYVARSH